MSDSEAYAFDLLVACADWPPGAARDRAIVLAARRINGDWSEFPRLARRHHLAPLCEESLRNAGIAPPDELIAHAQQLRRRALRMAGEAFRLIGLLEQAGCTAVPIKGALLSDRLFGDLALRHSVDIDLLVNWSDFRRAVETLRSQGYTLLGQQPPWDDWRIGHWRAMAKDVALVDPQGTMTIELHHRLKDPASLLPGLGMADATETAKLAGREARAFGQADLFAYLCVHAATSFWERLKWLADIRALLAGKDLAEIAALQRHSEQLGTERCTALGLLLCHRLWGQPIPEEIARWPEHAPWLADLERASLAALHAPIRNRSSLASSLDRRRLRELRSDRAYRQSMWREFLYDRELLETVYLPRPLRALYFPLRVLLFLRRKLGIAPDPRRKLR